MSGDARTLKTLKVDRLKNTTIAMRVSMPDDFLDRRRGLVAGPAGYRRLNEHVEQAASEQFAVGEPRTLCRFPNGGGRNPTANVPGDFVADRRTTATATTSVRRSMVMHSGATDGRSACQSQGKRPSQPLDHRSGCPRCR